MHRRRARVFASFFLAIGLSLAVAAPFAQSLPVPEKLVALTDAAGQQRLLDSTHKAFWPLIASFETQKNQAYCAVASSVTVLNAMGVPRPRTEQYPDFPYYTQDAFFRDVDPKIASPEVVRREGMTLQQVADALAGFPVKVERKYAQDMTLDEFRRLIGEATRSTERFVLVNFDRQVTGAEGRGHWSPAAAYHAPSDSVLILDVARYKYPPVWIPTEMLFRAAQSKDSTSGRSRGLVLVSR